MVRHLFLRTLKRALQSYTGLYFFFLILIWILFCVWVKRLVMRYYENYQGGVKRCVGTWCSWRNKHFHSYGCWKQQKKDKWWQPESKFLIAAIILTIIRIKALGITIWSQPEQWNFTNTCRVYIVVSQFQFCKGFWVCLGTGCWSLLWRQLKWQSLRWEGVWKGCRTRMESCEVFCLVEIFSIGTCVQQVLKLHITPTQKPEMSGVCTELVWSFVTQNPSDLCRPLAVRSEEAWAMSVELVSVFCIVQGLLRSWGPALLLAERCRRQRRWCFRNSFVYSVSLNKLLLLFDKLPTRNLNGHWNTGCTWVMSRDGFQVVWEWLDELLGVL